MTITYAIFDYKGEHAVAHMGLAKVAGEEGFRTVWVVDQICSTFELAMEAQLILARAAIVREKMEEADRKALARRR